MFGIRPLIRPPLSCRLSHLLGAANVLSPLGGPQSSELRLPERSAALPPTGNPMFGEILLTEIPHL